MENKEYKLKDLPFDRVFFWSYDFDNAKLPLSEILWIIIKKGDIPDLIMLFKAFPVEDMKKIYMKKIRPILSGEDKKFYNLRPDAKPDTNTARLMDTIFKAWDNYVVSGN